MGINCVHSGLLVAVGTQLPAVQSGPQQLRPGLRGRNGHREVWVSPGVWETKEGKGCLEPVGCSCWGWVQGCKGAPTVGVRAKGLLRRAEDRMERSGGLGCPSLAEPGGERGCEQKPRSMETAAPWAGSPVLRCAVSLDSLCGPWRWGWGKGGNTWQMQCGEDS